MNLLMQWNENVLVRDMSDDGTKPESQDCRETTVRYLAGSGATDAGGNWVLALDYPADQTLSLWESGCCSRVRIRLWEKDYGK